jgi:hypothetical protein
MSDPIDLLYLWVKTPTETEDNLSFWVGGATRPSEDAILITADNVEAWLSEDSELACRMTIELHDDPEQARKAAIRNGYDPYITEFGGLPSGAGATLILTTSESYDGLIHVQRDGEDVSHRDPTRVSCELTREQIDFYDPREIQQAVARKKAEEIAESISHAAALNPFLMPHLQLQLSMKPGATIPLGEFAPDESIEGWDDLSEEQRFEVQEEAAAFQPSPDDTILEARNEMRHRAQAKADQILGRGMTP